MLYAKTINDKPEKGGYRLLITSAWPAKFLPSWADGFNPNLAPSDELYDSLLERKISFENFREKYLQALDSQSERLKKLKKEAKEFEITLISYPNFEGKSIGKIVLEKIESIQA